MATPGVFAQNDIDEEDRQAEQVMRTLMEYNIRNSEYPLAFVFAVLDAMVNPVSYLELRYDEAYQTIKRMGDKGVVRTTIKDEQFSGFQIGTVPADEILITNVNEFYLQKQRAILRRKFVDYDYLESKYKGHKNWQHIKPGVKSFYDPAGELFYDQDDDTNATMGEEVIYYNRREDLEIPYVNGIYMGNDDPLDNRIKHRDNKDRPKYPFVKFGYHPISSRFYFYKSLAFELGPDYQLINEMYRMVMDRTFMEGMSPLGVFGKATKIDKSVMMPGAVTAFDKDTTIKQLIQPGNLSGGYKALETIEQSMKESSQDEMRRGIAGVGGRTAYEISRLEENSRIQLGLFGKMVGGAAKEVGELMINIVIHHQTVGEVDEILAGTPRLKFRTFLLSDQEEKGKSVTKKVVFDKEMIGSGLTDKQKKRESYKRLNEEGGLDSNTRIYRVNPYLFSRLKFKTFVEAESDKPISKSFQKILNLEGYDKMIANPFVDRRAITRDFLVKSFAEKDPDQYMAKEGEEVMPEKEGGSRDIQSLMKQKALEGAPQ